MLPFDGLLSYICVHKHIYTHRLIICANHSLMSHSGVEMCKSRSEDIAIARRYRRKLCVRTHYGFGMRSFYRASVLKNKTNKQTTKEKKHSTVHTFKLNILLLIILNNDFFIIIISN